jgi:hypothetical protein
MMDNRHKQAMQDLEHEMMMEMQKHKDDLNKDFEKELESELEVRIPVEYEILNICKLGQVATDNPLKPYIVATDNP